MSFFTPLRYPGGKGRLGGFFSSLVRMNGLENGHYAEPYAGGAAVAFVLLSLELVRKVHINDIDKSIFAFWHSVINQTDEICSLIRGVPLTMEEWRRQKSINLAANEVDLLELGFSAFYLNRTNRSGIINGGVIGGKGQAGKWKLDARFNRADLISRIQRIGMYANRISLTNIDAAVFIQEELPLLPPRSLVYIDPPYYIKGGDLYPNYYRAEDHERISRLVGSIDQSWVVSYDNHPAIRSFYDGFDQQTFNLHYSAQERYVAQELMVFKSGLIRPSEIQPSRAMVS